MRRMEWSFKDDEDSAFTQFFAPKPTAKWDTEVEEIPDEGTAADGDLVRNEYEGFEAALLKIAALDPIQEDLAPPSPVTPFVFDSLGTSEPFEPFDDEEDIIDIPFNPDPSFSFETVQFETNPASTPLEVFDYDQFEEEQVAEDTTPPPVVQEVEVSFDAERRFMGARREALIFGSAPQVRREEFGLSKELFEVLRKTALLTTSPKEVRDSYFSIIETPVSQPSTSNEDSKENSATSVVESHEVEDLDIMQLRPVPRNNVGIMDRVQTPSKEAPAEATVTETQVETILERARHTKIDPVIDPEATDDDGSYFRDLSAKNDMFGTTMELDAKKLRRQEKGNAKWERGDDDIFVAKDEKHHHRRSRKSEKVDSSDPITMEIVMEEPKKKSRLMEILTKKL